MKKVIKISLIIVIICSLVASIFFTPVITVLSIRRRKVHPQRFYSIDGYSKGFVISYTHSVNKGRVHDFYKAAEKKKIELYKTSFVSYGAGIPEAGETPGAIFTVTDDSYVIENLNRIVPRLVMAVGLTAKHTIVFDTSFQLGQKEFFFTDFFEPQTSIVMEYIKVSLYDYLRHKIE